MQFNSYEFILFFLPIVLLIYYFLAHRFSKDLCIAFISLSSFLFYIHFCDYKVGLILPISIIVNWLLTRYINHNKFVLIITILANIFSLLYFKYTVFLVESINSIINGNYECFNVLLPLGISFYTFSQISFAVDSYREETTDITFLEYIFYILYFPKLIQGPITKCWELISQIRTDKTFRFDCNSFNTGIYLFTIGLSKKVLIADTIARGVNVGYSDIGGLNSISALVIVIGYTLQIYFDFSGYSDMAVGVSKMLNIELPFNFDSPYRSCDILDFWKRWHISLTCFFKEYVYIPLGGNKRGSLRTYFNVMVVFVLSGLWHGANYTFLAWGMIHGLISVFCRVFKTQLSKVPVLIRIIINFIVINITWVFFRATTINEAITILKKIVNFHGTQISKNIIDAYSILELIVIEQLTNFSVYKHPNIVIFGILVGSLIIVLSKKNSLIRFLSFRPKIWNLLVTECLLLWSLLSLSQLSVFIYNGF